MAIADINGIGDLRSLVGRRLGPSAWREVTQREIDAFAALTGDDQWIHVDVERAAAEGPFGTTIAQGNLTLSLTDEFRRALMRTAGFAMAVNYGWNKVRFPAPVRVGSHIRATAEIVQLDDVGNGWWQLVTNFVVEVEGAEKPCCVADSVGRLLAR